jgi:hypothetical protein
MNGDSQPGQFAVPVNPRFECYSWLVDSLMKHRLQKGPLEAVFRQDVSPAGRALSGAIIALQIVAPRAWRYSGTL